MLTSLGFDTVVVQNHSYDDNSLSALFALLFPCNIKNFIFLTDFDFKDNSLSLENAKKNNLKKRISEISPRGVHCKAFYNLSIDKGAAFNKDIKRVYAVKKHSSLFLKLPLFTESNYQNIAQDINHLIYRQKTFSVFSHFDNIVSTTSQEFCTKLMKNSEIGFAMDINYIFDPSKISVVSQLIRSRALILPMISHDISNYVGILKEAECFMEKIGKKNYYQLCSQIRRCASKFDC